MNPEQRRKPGRPTKKPLTVKVQARMTQDEREKFIRLGGSEWLRKQIAQAGEEKS